MMDLEKEAQRFDADGEYVRRWLPVLSRLPTEYIHAPWKAPPQVVMRVVDSRGPRCACGSWLRDPFKGGNGENFKRTSGSLRRLPPITLEIGLPLSPENAGSHRALFYGSCSSGPRCSSFQLYLSVCAR